MSVVFRCKASGNTITFVHEVDIITTRANPAYEEVVEPVKEEKKTVAKKTVVKTEE